MAKDTRTHKDTTEEEGPRSFGVFLQKVASGEAELELSRELFELGRVMKVEARTRNADMKGELTLKLKFVVPPQGPATVVYEVSKKTPKRQTSKGFFWTTEQGNFTPDNPEQQKLPFRQVAGPQGRDVPEDAGRAPREA
jgi:hypothetical protein